MTGLEVLLNNIGSLALIPIVITIVLTLKNAEIDSLKQRNETLKEETKLLGLFRVSEVEKDYKALKNFFKEQKKEAERVKNDLDKATKKLKNVKSLNKEQAGEIIELFQIAMKYISLLPSPMAQDLISQPLYMMEGPIGDLWREYLTERKRRVKERESGSST